MADAGDESALVERDAYLDELIDMSPSTDSLLDEVRKGMTIGVCTRMLPNNRIPIASSTEPR